VRRCIRYVIDSLKPIKWQWFDLPFYNDDHDFEFIDEEHQNDEENGIVFEMKEFVQRHEKKLSGTFR
jgi:hypothetical protein